MLKIYVEPKNGGGFIAHTGNKKEWEYGSTVEWAVHQLEISFPHLKGATVHCIG